MAGSPLKLAGKQPKEVTPGRGKPVASLDGPTVMNWKNAKVGVARRRRRRRRRTENEGDGERELALLGREETIPPDLNLLGRTNRELGDSGQRQTEQKRDV